MKNFEEEIKLLAFCLMPNHIHLLIKQSSKDSIKTFSQSLFTRYSMYFNKRYNRTGSLFQGRYKATNVINKDYLLDVTRYIHKNPLKLTKNLINSYSSYAHYLNIFKLPWVKNEEVINYFNKSGFIKNNNIKNYKRFVEEFRYQNEELDLTTNLKGSDL
ncbi:MAG: transposase [Patescibacteria group bacterium]